jgi:hypothetical protein
MGSYVRARPGLAAQADLPSLSRGSGSHLVSKAGPRQEQWQRTSQRYVEKGSRRLGWAVSGMGAQMGARSAPKCSALLQAAPPRAFLTCAGGRQCRPRPSGNIPGGQGVASSNPAIPTSAQGLLIRQAPRSAGLYLCALRTAS